LTSFVGSLSATEATLFVSAFLIVSVIVGLALELLTYKVYRSGTALPLEIWATEIPHEQGLPPSAISKLIALCNSLWGASTSSDANLTPPMIWTLLYNMWSKGSE